MSSKNNSISNWLKQFSVETWDRIAFARNRSGLRIHETTLTQNLIYDLIKSQEKLGNNVLLFESKDEKTNGDDIECYVQYKEKYLFFPLQAKLLYKNSKYGAISHKNRLGWQIDALMEYANDRGGIPFYLFYNYCQDTLDFAHFLSLLEHRIPQYYGCTCVTAKHLLDRYTHKTNGHREWIRKPSFYNLHPRNGIPFFELLNIEAVKSVLENESINIDDKSIKQYTLEELKTAEEWKDLIDVNGQQLTEDKYRFDEIYHQPQKSIAPVLPLFRPKFRVIFSKVYD